MTYLLADIVRTALRAGREPATCVRSKVHIFVLLRRLCGLYRVNFAACFRLSGFGSTPRIGG